MRALALAAGLAAAACARHVGVKEQDAAVESRRVVVRALAYDAKGLPTVPAPLGRRPSSPGARFSIVHLERGRPVESYDVVVVGDGADFREPLRAVYEWTSAGVTWGLAGSAALLESFGSAGTPHVESGKDTAAAAAVLLVVVAAPAAVGATGGALVGLADGARSSAQELGKLLRGKRERLVAYTLYSYDARDRLVLMRLYAADRGREVARTEFRYVADAAVPARTEITNLQDGAAKVLE